MEKYISLSKREKRYQFIYLLGMLIVAIVVFSLIFFPSFESPFSGKHILEIQMLEQKNKFSKQQEAVTPLLETTYRKISDLKRESPQAYVENDIKNSINEVANSFENREISDDRKAGYLQIAKFYKMFFDDKRIAAKKTENITLFEKQFQECSIGLEKKENQRDAKLSSDTF